MCGHGGKGRKALRSEKGKAFWWVLLSFLWFCGAVAHVCLAGAVLGSRRGLCGRWSAWEVCVVVWIRGVGWRSGKVGRCCSFPLHPPTFLLPPSLPPLPLPPPTTMFTACARPRSTACMPLSLTSLRSVPPSPTHAQATHPCFPPSLHGCN